MVTYSQLIAFLDQLGDRYRRIDQAPEGKTEIVCTMFGNEISKLAKCIFPMIKIGRKAANYICAVIPSDRRKVILTGIVFAVLLTACSSITQTPTQSPTTVSASASPYDGSWEGVGTAQDGREITVKFTVTNGVISSFIYSSLNTDNSISCTGIDHTLVTVNSRPPITINSFYQTFGPDLTAEGTFTSPGSASGHISIIWQGHYTSRCSATLQAAWAATKQQVVKVTAAVPVSVSWCGKNVNYRDLLFQLLIFGIVNGSILALNAIGVTVIYSTVRTLNLAHGDVFALTTAFVTSTINIIGLNLDWPVGNRVLVLIGVLFGAVVLGSLLSVGVEELAFRPFRGRSKLAPLIASLGLSFILYQAALVWRTYQKSFIRGEHRSVPGLPEVPTDGIPNFLPNTNLLAGKIVFQGSVVFFLV